MLTIKLSYDWATSVLELIQAMVRVKKHLFESCRLQLYIATQYFPYLNLRRMRLN